MINYPGTRYAPLPARTRPMRYPLTCDPKPYPRSRSPCATRLDSPSRASGHTGFVSPFPVWPLVPLVEGARALYGPLRPVQRASGVMG